MNFFTSKHPQLKWGWITLLLLLMVAIRLYQLDTVALRGDEAFTVVHWTVAPFSEGYFDFIGKEPHPFGIFTIYWIWTGIAGITEFAARFLPLLSNVLGGAVMMAFTHRLAKNWYVAYLAGLLWAVHPFLVWHAQDAHNYGLISFVSILTMYWFWRAIENPKRAATFRVWWPYIAAQTAGIYIYFFESFIFGVQAIVVFFVLLQNPHLWRVILKTWIAIAVLCLPVVIQLGYIVFVTEYEGNADYADVNLLFEVFIPTLWLGEGTTTSFVVGVGFVVASIVGLAVVRMRWALFVGVWAFAPFVMLYVISQSQNLFRPRYVIHVVPAFIMIALLVPYVLSRHVKRQDLRLGLVTSVALVICVASVLELRNYFTSDPPKAPDWRGLTTYLDARTTEHDTLLTAQIDPALEYYYDKPVLFIPWAAEEDTTLYNFALMNFDAVYVLADSRTGPAGEYFQTNAQLILGDTYPGVSQVRPWQVNPREIEYSLDIQFGDIAILRGYTALDGPNGGAILLLYWEPLRQTDVDYSVLTHVSQQPDAPPFAVLDHGVANSIISTRVWEVGTVVRDPVAMPADQRGPAVVRVGVYQTGAPDTLVSIDDAALQIEHEGRFLLPVPLNLMQP